MIEPLVLLPGMSCDSRLYEPQIRVLSREMPVMVMPITGGQRVEEIASSILPHLPDHFALAGLSMGGIVAMEVLKRVPDKITRLCLMDTNPLAEPPHVAAAREPLIIKARMGEMEAVAEEAFLADFLAPSPERPRILAEMRQMTVDLGSDVFVNHSRALQRRPDQQDVLRKCKAPTLVMCGELDPLTPVKRHSFMAELMPHAELRVIPDCGHVPTLEAPDVVLQAWRDWLAQPLMLR